MRTSAAARRRSTAARRAPRPSAETVTRVVSDRRWVHRNQLELGMYVAELDRPWIETRFLFQGFRIDSHETLRAVQDACEYARVETEKVARVPTGSVHRLVGPPPKD